MLEHRRGRKPKTERAERRLQARTLNLPANLRRTAASRLRDGKVCLKTESIMTNEANSIDPKAWKYAEKTPAW